MTEDNKTPSPSYHVGWPHRLTLRNTKVHADEGQKIYTTATGHGYEKHDYVRLDVALSLRDALYDLLTRPTDPAAKQRAQECLATTEGYAGVKTKSF